MLLESQGCPSEDEYLGPDSQTKNNLECVWTVPSTTPNILEIVVGITLTYEWNPR